MDLNEKAIFWLDLAENLSLTKKYEILNFYQEPQDLFNNFRNDYNKFFNILTPNLFEEMCKSLNMKYINNKIETYQRQGVQIVTCYSQHYPKRILNYHNAPLVLYAKGDLSLMNNFCFAVVGTRRISRYGKFVTEKFTRELVANNFTIVSGLADGVDTVAAQTALKNGGKTIAVLGGGFDHIYPKSNTNLANEIIQKGLLLSEYRPEIKPNAYHFPVRNRIIAALSEGVLITEAGLKSGAIYTKEYCLEYNKNLFVVPGNIDSFGSAGCNEIIKTCQSCMVTDIEDILFHYNKINAYKELPKQKRQLSMEEQMVMNVIQDDEVAFEEIMIKTNLDTKSLSSLLISMEVNGIISRIAGNYYCKKER